MKDAWAINRFIVCSVHGCLNLHGVANIARRTAVQSVKSLVLLFEFLTLRLIVEMSTLSTDQFNLFQ